jgi:hypothetical protein
MELFTLRSKQQEERSRDCKWVIYTSVCQTAGTSGRAVSGETLYRLVAEIVGSNPA